MDIKAPHEKSFEHTTSNIQSFPIDHFVWFLKLHPQKNEVFYTILFSYLAHVYSTVVDECKCCVRPEITPSSWLCVLAFYITVQTIEMQIQKVSVSRSMCQSRNCISFDDYSYFIRQVEVTTPDIKCSQNYSSWPRSSLLSLVRTYLCFLPPNTHLVYTLEKSSQAFLVYCHSSASM